MLEVKFYDNIDDDLLKFAVIAARYNGKWVYCKHKDRDTYEVAGGHREENEKIIDTAKRELFEETGADEFELIPVCVYSVTGKNRVNDNGEESFGMLYYADIKSLKKLPESEIEKVYLFDELPSNLTYPLIQPILIKRVEEKVLNYKNVRVISIKENPEYKDASIEYIQNIWANEKSREVYEDCITSCITTLNPLPQWYLLMDKNKIVGCAGLITNDFISRMDLYPWVSSLYIEKEYRGNAYGSILLERARSDAKKGGFSNLYLCTDHIGFYEHYGFEYIGTGYHPWGESSRIYCISL